MGSTRDRDTIYNSFDSEAVTVDATVGGVSLTAATYQPVIADDMPEVTEATLATITNVGAEIRITVEGTTVTAAIGTVIADGQTFEVWGIIDIAALRMIRTGAVSSIITAVYSR